MRTASWYATLPLRMRVSMSAIGSVIVMSAHPLPGRLRHTRHLAGVDHLSQADAAQPELAVDGLGTAASPAPRVRADLELGLALLLLDECLLGHDAPTAAGRRDGTGNRTHRGVPCPRHRWLRWSRT